MVTTPANEINFQVLSQRALSKDTNLKSGAVKMDFTGGITSVLLDFQTPEMMNKVGMILGLFVDNSANSSPITITMGQTTQPLVIPPSCQGYFPILSAVPDRFIAESVGGVVVPIFFLNYRPDPFIWQTNTGGGSGAPLFVRDVYRTTMTWTGGIVPGADAVIVPGNVNASQIIVQANSANTASAWLNFGAAAAVDTVIELPPGAVFIMGEPGVIETRDLHLFGTGGKVNVGYC